MVICVSLNTLVCCLVRTIILKCSNTYIFITKPFILTTVLSENYTVLHINIIHMLTPPHEYSRYYMFCSDAHIELRHSIYLRRPTL